LLAKLGRFLFRFFCVFFVAGTFSGAAEPPAGFTPLFNGRDLTGWRGRPHLDPRQEAEGTPEERATRQKQWNDDRAAHWKVQDGVIVSDGHGVFLTTDRDYGDFELLIDWMLPAPCADSGIYLRGIPQVQIWDPACPRDEKHGAPKGSGGLWNNPADAPGKWPLVKADRPIGEWNTTRITMVGDKVTVELNGQRVVDSAPLANFFEKGKPLPASGPIQIQTHGAPMHVRNVFIKELAEGVAAVVPPAEEGFVSLFDGKSLAGWRGATQGYEVVDGELRCRKGAGGKLLTEKEFGDFTLRFDFRLTPGANNGLGIRAPVEGDAAFNAMELQILDDAHPKYASLQPWQVHGSIYGVVAAERGSLKPAGEWNTEEVTVNGSRVKVVVNGKMIVDADVAPFRDGQPTLDGRPHPGLARTSGHIGFLGHGDEVHFRNIRIRETR
jgi:hypothetical protein